MRARNLKPGFFSNELLAECQPLTRLLFEGLWCIADREGRLEDRPKRIKRDVLPYDEIDIEMLLEELAGKTEEDGQPAFIIRYQVDRKKYIQIVNFLSHNKPYTREVISVIPPCPDNAITLTKHNLVHAEAQPSSCQDSASTQPGCSVSCLLSPVSPILSPELKDSSSSPDGATAPQKPDSNTQNGKSKQKLFPEDAVEYGLAYLLRSEILKNLPGARVPKATPEGMSGWCTHIDRMIRLDARAPDEIRRIILWCQQSQFWRAVILSTENLRDKWEILALQSKREDEKPHETYGTANARPAASAAKSKYPMRCETGDSS